VLVLLWDNGLIDNARLAYCRSTHIADMQARIRTMMVFDFLFASIVYPAVDTNTIHALGGEKISIVFTKQEIHKYILLAARAKQHYKG
jgi:hypothetical protein